MEGQANHYRIIMFSSRTRLERKIKELNAIMAEYRREMDEAERALERKEIGASEAERVRTRCRKKMDSISEKIRTVRAELESMK